ncbi:MAG: hypothetical protein AAGA25_02635 [Planctomycetota bacterium]
MTDAIRRRPLHAVVIGVLICLVLAGGAVAAFEDQLIPRRLGTVVEGTVYRSGQIDRRLIRGVLQSHNIERVVLLHGYATHNPDHVAEMQAIKDLSIDYERFPMSGNGLGTPEQYASVVELLHDAVQNDVITLVHRGAGTQRTGGTVAAYRLLVEKADPIEVTLESMRYDWSPNDPDSLWPEFLNENMGVIAQYLVDAGVIDEVPDPLPIFGLR